MLNLHIFYVIVATIILIIFAESQKLRKITWILIIGCVGYLILILTPECSNPYNDVPVKAIIPDTQKVIINESELNEDAVVEEYQPVEIVSVEQQENIEEKFIQKLKINSVLITTDIIDKEPVDSAKLFLNDIEYLYCYTTVFNPYNENKIIHNWQYEGEDYFNNTINIGRSDNWRCWSRISVRPELSGDWEVSVSDTLGNDLDSIEFTLLPTEE